MCNIWSFLFAMKQLQLPNINNFTALQHRVVLALYLLIVIQLLPFAFPPPAEKFPNSFPQAQEAPRYSITVPISAYNALPEQTDATPCITANGFNLCEAEEENVVAANFIKLGARIKIPELYGDKEFLVVDRMNPRYTYKVDIWKKELADAKRFGVQIARIEVYDW